MANYFFTEREAEEHLNSAVSRRNPLVFYGRILNHGAEKWMVDYVRKPSGPHVTVLEDLTYTVDKIRGIKTEEESRRELLQAEKERQQEAEAKERTEKAKRIEEAKRAEEARKSAIISERDSKRVCIMCGNPLGFFQKLVGAKKHKECSSFSG